MIPHNTLSAASPNAQTPTEPNRSTTLLANLIFYPTNIEPNSSIDGWISYGDMHGNSLKMLYCAIHSGCIHMPTKAFREFVTFYNSYDVLNPSFFSEDKLQKILSKIKRNSESNMGIRFIGDMLADRGLNDYFTLSLIKRLDTLNVKFKIILSNHDLYFIYTIEKYFNHPNPKTFSACLPVKFNLYNQSQSLASFASLIDKVINDSNSTLTKNDLFNLYRVYIKHLLILDLEIDNHNLPLIFSHAPIHPHHLNTIAKNHDINYPYPLKDSQWLQTVDIDALKTTIDTYNIKVLESIQKMELLQSANFSENRAEPNYFSLLYACTWNREQEILKLPHIHNPHIFSNIHGHNTGILIDKWHIDLDTMLGKFVGHSNYISGELTFYKTTSSPRLIIGDMNTQVQDINDYEHIISPDKIDKTSLSEYLENDDHEKVTSYLSSLNDASFSNSERFELASTLNDFGPSCFCIALSKGRADAVSAYMKGIQKLELTSEQLYTLIIAKNIELESALAQAVLEEHTNVIAYYINGVIDLDLTLEHKISLLTNSHCEQPVLYIAMQNQTKKSVLIYISEIARSNLPEDVKITILSALSKTGYCGLWAAATKKDISTCSLYIEAINRSTLSDEAKIKLRAILQVSLSQDPETKHMLESAFPILYIEKVQQPIQIIVTCEYVEEQEASIGRKPKV